MEWYIDFEAYQFNGQYYVKEISVISNQCYNYFVKNSNHIPKISRNSTTQFQFMRHRLPWHFGEITFQDAIADIQQKVKDDVI